ncbi:MAG: LamG domain-containing protein, partial [Armatimonadota bacterium]|nr:LamG domain-containing protein [Armatimonadota bacterium]
RNNRVERATIPLRDDGTNTWIHPAERLGYQVQAVKALLGGKARLESLEKAVAEMARQPGNSPQLAAKSAQLHQQLWAEVARVQPQGTTPEMLTVLSGLRFEFDPLSSINPALASGKIGPAEVRARVRSESWSPTVSARLEVVPPTGWQVAAAEPASAIKSDELAGLKAGVVLKEKSDATTVNARLTATLGSVPLSVPVRFDIGRREILNWMVLGPFANASGALPDTRSYPAEERFDLNGEYDGVGGKVKWQPVVLNNKFLHFDDRFKPQAPATAFAASILRADRATTATLDLFCRGAAELWLNNKSVLAINAPDGGGKSVRVELNAGDNILFCKSSVLSGKWEIAAEIKELSADERSHIQQVPAAELKAIAALPPPPPSPPSGSAAGSLANTGGVAWREVLADDFGRRDLGGKWKVAGGQWTIKDSVLDGRERSFVALAEKVSLPVRIEYDARSPAPADLSCFWLREPPDVNSGYLLAFASGDAGSRIQIEGATEQTSTTPAAKATPNRWHHVIGQILPDGTAQLFVDGKLVLSARRPPPTKGAAFAGLWTWGGGQFDNVHISTK